jgi:hypothetical protein
MAKVFKAIGNAITSVVKAVVNVVSNVVKAVVNVAASVVNFVAQPFMGMLGGTPDIPTAAAEVERQQGVLVQREGSNVAIPVVYGYRKVGGSVVFAETGSTNNRYLYVVYVFSEGLVEGLREVFIDDWQLPINLTANLNAGQVVDVTTDRYAGRVRLQWSPGQYFANPASSTVGTTAKAGIFAEAPSFTANMRFNGLAVLAARYEWKEIKTQADSDSNPFSGNIPQVQISLLGRRIASLLVANPENTAYDAAPVRYSTNPAEILLDYLRNPRYGKGLTNDDIHWDSWKKAAVKCNTIVTYLSTTSDITGPIMTSNFVLPTDQTIFANVKTLLMGFRAYMPYVQGKYKLRIEDAGNETDILSGAATIAMTAVTSPYLKSTYTGNVVDIVGNITYTGIEKSAKYNVVSVSYVDPDQKFSVQQVIYPETESERQIYIDRDGGRENKLDATFPTLTNYAMAKDMARLLFNKSRRQETCSLTISSEGLELEPGDSIRIQSNVLNFGNDPWRIISLRVNDNMTVDIGCVRNPDDIYPYARVGEEDIVLAVYVPKGSIIYYPGSSNTPLIGLVPPTNAIYPADIVITPGNPGPTNPNAPGGGGVGGGGGGGGVTPVNPPVVPVPPPPPFNAILALKSSSATRVGTTNFLINVVFTQPQDGLYSYAILWWRYNRFSPWIEIRVDTKPGAGGDIPIIFGPSLPPGDYEFYVRAFATDGRASINVTRGQASVRANSSELNPNLTGIATASTVQVAEGWTVPPSEVPATPRYDDDIERISIRPKLSSGAPLSPRRMTVSLQQITQSFTAPVNALIDGVRIYYKISSDTYWSYEDVKFATLGQYVPGQVVNFDLVGDFGSRVYPSAIIPNTVNDGLQKYSFLIRLSYADGQPALKQLGPMLSAPVEINGTGLYDFVSVGTRESGGTRTAQSELIPAGFNSTFKTVDEDPNKSSASGADLTPSIFKIFGYPFDDRIQFTFNPPITSVSKWRGYRLRYREVVPGTNPDFREVDIPGVAGIDNKVFFDLQGQGFRLNVKYEWVISVLIASTGNVIDADNCLYGRYTVPSAQREDNIYSFFGFTIRNTKEAIGALRVTFPALPTVNPKSWIKKQVLQYDIYNSNVFLSYKLTKSSTGFPLNQYMRFRFQAPPTGATHIICYRRIKDTAGLSRTTPTTVAKYFTLGPWEKVRVALSALTTDAEGFKTLNVRGPIDWIYFNANYQVSGGSTSQGTALVANIWGPSPNAFPYPTSSVKVSNIYPMSRFGVGNAETATRTHEYLFVLEDSGTESTKGLLLRDFFTYNQTTDRDYRSEVDGFISTFGAVPKDNVINDITIFNSLDAGFGRNLNEAITAPSIDKMNDPAAGFGSGPPAYGDSSRTTITRFMEQPTDGNTVY